jgi:hypothetical protein
MDAGINPITMTEFVGFTKPTHNRLYQMELDEGRFLVKVYGGQDAPQKCRRECDAIHAWQQAGFHTTELKEMKIPSLAGESYLVMRFIEFASLREILRDEGRTIDEKLQLVETLFVQMQLRHHQALSSANRTIVHYDPSTDNIHYGDGRFVFIDLETPIPARVPILDSVSIELATTARWIVRDMGKDHLHSVAERMAPAYFEHHRPVLKRVVSRTRSRPFQFIHRRNDRKKKLANPAEVTKYDIADSLNRILC